MLNNKRILAVIPARGGSKGLPRKNIRLFCGKPLILWTILQARESKYIDWIVVSTDDREIVEIAKDYADEVINRPAGLAKDTTSMIRVVRHAVKEISRAHELHYETFVLLQPTSPLRTSHDIDCSIESFFHNDSESLVSGFHDTIHWSFSQKRKFLVPVFGWELIKQRRQKLPSVFKPNGAMYIMNIECFLKRNSLYTEKTIAYIMPKNRSIDIDNEDDFRFAEYLMNEQFK